MVSVLGVAGIGLKSSSCFVSSRAGVLHYIGEGNRDG